MSDYQYDAFISYAHLDDNPEAGIRWVTSLQNALTGCLERHLGRAARIWRDTEQLKTLDDFEIRILAALQESATMVVVTTPAFVKRDWFTKEYQHFRATNEYLVQDTSRILIVYKTQITQDELPEYFRQFSGFRMFREDDEGAASTFLPDKTQKDFWLMAAKIALAIHELIAPPDGPTTV